MSKPGNMDMDPRQEEVATASIARVVKFFASAQAPSPRLSAIMRAHPSIFKSWRMAGLTYAQMAETLRDMGIRAKPEYIRKMYREVESQADVATAAAISREIVHEAFWRANGVGSTAQADSPINDRKLAAAGRPQAAPAGSIPAKTEPRHSPRIVSGAAGSVDSTSMTDQTRGASSMVANGAGANSAAIRLPQPAEAKAEPKQAQQSARMTANDPPPLVPIPGEDEDFTTVFGRDKIPRSYGDFRRRLYAHRHGEPKAPNYAFEDGTAPSFNPHLHRAIIAGELKNWNELLDKARGK